MNNVIYICNRKKPCAKDNPYCYSEGAEGCMHTIDPYYAKYGAIKDEEELKSDRFELFGDDYWERIH